MLRTIQILFAIYVYAFIARQIKKTTFQRSNAMFVLMSVCCWRSQNRFRHRFIPVIYLTNPFLGYVWSFHNISWNFPVSKVVSLCKLRWSQLSTPRTCMVNGNGRFLSISASGKKKSHDLFQDIRLTIRLLINFLSFSLWNIFGASSFLHYFNHFSSCRKTEAVKEMDIRDKKSVTFELKYPNLKEKLINV